MKDINDKTPRERLEEFVSACERDSPMKDILMREQGFSTVDGTYDRQLRVSDIRALLDAIKESDEITLEDSVCPVCDGKGWHWFRDSPNGMDSYEDCNYCHGQGVISVSH